MALIFTDIFGRKFDIVIKADKYKSGNLAILFEQPITAVPILTATVDPPWKLGKYECAIKDWSENEGVEKFLVGLCVIESTGKQTDFLYMRPNVYKINFKKLKEIVK
jgi:hypothetical protein